MDKIKRLIEAYASEKKKIKFFDSNCWLGYPLPGSLVKITQTVEEILKIMDCSGIEKAIISASAGLNYSPVYGNKLLLSSIKKSDRLYGAALLLPEATGEPGDLSGYIASLISNKVVMVRLFPKIHNFTLSEYCSGSLLRLLQKRRVPVSIWHTQTSWDEIDKLCGSYPGLPLIVEGVGRKLLYDNRIFYPLLKNHKNLFLGSHNLTNYLGLDDIVKKFGAKKVIFGTFIPENDPEAALMPVIYGNFSIGEKRRIAGGNLQLLIKGIRR